jgi:hypothetical protein
MFVLIETEELYEQILLEFYLKLWIWKFWEASLKFWTVSIKLLTI